MDGTVDSGGELLKYVGSCLMDDLESHHLIKLESNRHLPNFPELMVWKLVQASDSSYLNFLNLHQLYQRLQAFETNSDD